MKQFERSLMDTVIYVDDKFFAHKIEKRVWIYASIHFRIVDIMCVCVFSACMYIVCVRVWVCLR